MYQIHKELLLMGGFMVSMNPLYENPSNISQIKDLFKSNEKLPSIKLPKFFSDYDKIKLPANFKKDSHPIHFSYSVAVQKDLEKFLSSKQFLDFVLKITGKKLKFHSKLIKLDWKDYSIINDDAIEKPGFDVIIDFSSNWNDEGGSIVYTDGKGETFFIPAEPNNLVLVQRKKGVHRFYQYVNHKAKGKRLFLIGISYI